MLAETKLSDLEKEMVMLKKRAFDSEELVQDLLVAHADIIIDRDDKLREIERKLEAERAKMAETCVKILPLPRGKIETVSFCPTEFGGSPRLTAKQDEVLKVRSSACKEKRVSFKPAVIKRVARKAEPIPDNYTVGETYVSGMAVGFGEIGF